MIKEADIRNRDLLHTRYNIIGAEVKVRVLNLVHQPDKAEQIHARAEEAMQSCTSNFFFVNTQTKGDNFKQQSKDIHRRCNPSGNNPYPSTCTYTHTLPYTPCFPTRQGKHASGFVLYSLSATDYIYTFAAIGTVTFPLFYVEL